MTDFRNIRLEGFWALTWGAVLVFSSCFASTIALAVPASNVPEVQGTLEQTSMVGVDPKTGRMLWKATVKSLDAQTGVSNKLTGTMHSATITLYQNGKAEAILFAPIARGDLGTKTVIATGGVTMRTVGSSAHNTAKCDELIWHSDTNQMIGIGHVVINGPGFVQTGPSFQADTKLQSVQIPAPGHGSGVHATLDVKSSGLVKHSKAHH